MRTGLKVNDASVTNITVVSVFGPLVVYIASAPSSRPTNAAVVRLSWQIVHWQKFANFTLPHLAPQLG